MDDIRIAELPVKEIGKTIQMGGIVWVGNNNHSYITLFPDTKLTDLNGQLHYIQVTLEDWKKLMFQADVVETEILVNDEGKIKKSTFRKSQRAIDNAVQWKVFHRDSYCCRYCGRNAIPLSVDHIILWEELGPTIEENLLTACKKCNKTRGNMQYEDWLNSEDYRKISTRLTQAQKQANLDILSILPSLRERTVTNKRSR